MTNQSLSTLITFFAVLAMVGCRAEVSKTTPKAQELPGDETELSYNYDPSSTEAPSPTTTPFTEDGRIVSPSTTVVAPVYVVPEPVAAAVPVVAACGTLYAGTTLYGGESLRSCNGIYHLEVQTDGNVVLYKDGLGAIWSTAVVSPGARFAFQTDGNIVVWGADNVGKWWTGTHYYPNSRLVLQDDGNLVLYTEDNQVPSPFFTDTHSVKHDCGWMDPFEVLRPEEFVDSCNGRYRLKMQADGNLVMYDRTSGSAIFSSGTMGYTNSTAIMQGQGNFAVISYDGKTVYQSATHGNARAYMAITNDGYLRVMGVYGLVKELATPFTVDLGVEVDIDISF